MTGAELRLAAYVCDEQEATDGPVAEIRTFVQRYLLDGYAFRDAFRLAVEVVMHGERGGPQLLILGAERPSLL